MSGAVAAADTYALSPRVSLDGRIIPLDMVTGVAYDAMVRGGALYVYNDRAYNPASVRLAASVGGTRAPVYYKYVANPRLRNFYEQENASRVLSTGVFTARSALEARIKRRLRQPWAGAVEVKDPDGNTIMRYRVSRLMLSS